MNSKYIIGGIAACLGIGYLTYYFSNRSKGITAKPSQSLTKSQTMSILQDLHHSLRRTCIVTADFASRIKAEAPYRISDDEVRQIILTKTDVPELLKAREAVILERHNITEESFKFACEIKFAADIEVQNLIAENKQDIENSFKGLPPRMPTVFPEFLTEDLIVEIMKEVHDALKLRVYETMEILRAKGITISDPQFLTELEKSKVDQEADYKIFEKYGLNKFDKPAMDLIKDAVTKYNQATPFVVNRLNHELDSKNYALQMIIQGTFPREEIQTIRDRLHGRQPIETNS